MVFDMFCISRNQGVEQDAKNIIPSGSYEFFQIWLTIQLLYWCKLQIAISKTLVVLRIPRENGQIIFLKNYF